MRSLIQKRAECEIVILYGHGRKSAPWKWFFNKHGCNAGAAIMCWPVSNSDGIPSGQNLFTSWGGEPLDDGMGDWVGDAHGPDFIPTYPGPVNNNKALANVANIAQQTARSILKSCPCCKQVTITYAEIDKQGNQIDPPKQYGGAPPMRNIIIK